MFVSTESIPTISVTELAILLAGDTKQELQLIDVRETQEVAIASLPGFTILPLSDFPQWSGTITTRLAPERETLVLCHHGVRSEQMCQWLRSQGFTNVKNIKGGIDAYARLVDPSIPQY